MIPSSDDKTTKDRPSLLLTSNRSDLPTISILSSADDYQRSKTDHKIDRKKTWHFSLAIIAILGISSFFFYRNAQNLPPNVKSNLNNPLVIIKSETSGNPVPTNANRFPAAIDSAEIPTSAISTTKDVNTIKTSSAVLVDIPIEKSKTENVNSAPLNLEVHAETIPVLKIKQKPIGNVQSSNTKPHRYANKDTNSKLSKEDEVQKTLNAKNYDSDIILLSAIVANGNTNRPKSTEQRSNLSGDFKNNSTAINLDIVERNRSDETKNLLSRCEKLGGLEAKLCHDRICSGSWKSESICAAPKN